MFVGLGVGKANTKDGPSGGVAHYFGPFPILRCVSTPAHSIHVDACTIYIVSNGSRRLRNKYMAKSLSLWMCGEVIVSIGGH